jgi:hypothetical protein
MTPFAHNTISRPSPTFFPILQLGPTTPIPVPYSFSAAAKTLQRPSGRLVFRVDPGQSWMIGSGFFEGRRRYAGLYGRKWSDSG